jgi:hypothetical protein
MWSIKMKSSNWLLIGAAALAMAGCSSVLVYKPNPPVTQAPQRKLRVVVAPFESLASTRTPIQDFWDDCVGGLLLPGYTMLYERYVGPSFLADPEAANRQAQHKSSTWGTSYDEADDSAGYKSYSECLAEELRASGLFASVDYKKWDELADSASNYDLIITARFFYDRRWGKTCIGLGMPLVLLQELELVPVGAMHRELAFEVQALDLQSPGEPVWTKFVNVMDKVGGVTMFFPPGHTKYEKFRNSTPQLLAKAFLEVRDALNHELAPGGSLDKWAAAKTGR